MLSFAERYLSFFLDSIDWIYHCFLKLIICDFHSDFGANLEHATSAVRCHHDQLRDLWWAAPGEIKKNHVSHCSIWAASQVFFFFFFGGNCVFCVQVVGHDLSKSRKRWWQRGPEWWWCWCLHVEKCCIMVHMELGGGFKYFLFSPLPGEMIQFD